MGLRITRKGKLKSYYPDSPDEKELIIPEGVNYIDPFVFGHMRPLERIVIPATLTNIPSNNVFYGCASLKEIIVSEQNPMYESFDGVLYEKNSGVLYCCPAGKESIRFREHVDVIWGAAFYHCDLMENIIVPHGVYKIGDSAFLSCTHLKEIILPESVTRIGSYAFQNCINLKTFRCPDSVRQVGRQIFSGRLNLEQVTCRGMKIPVKGFSDHEDILGVLINKRFGVPWADRIMLHLMEMFADHPEDEHLCAYLNENFEAFGKILIDKKNTNLLEKMLSAGKITAKQAMDALILYANEQQKYEMQVMLMNYKNQCFSSETMEEKLKKFEL